MAESWDKLLSGYATDTLTEEEKRRLFEAALHDQTLFDALADDEALKTLLADPEARRRILASLQEQEPPEQTSAERGGWRDWFRAQSSLAWAGSLAAVGLVLIFGWQIEKEWGPAVRQVQEHGETPASKKTVDQAREDSEKDNLSGPREALQKKASLAEGKKAERPFIPDPAPQAEPDSVDRVDQVPAEAQKDHSITPLPPPSVPGRLKLKQSVQPRIAESLEMGNPDAVPEASAPPAFMKQRAEEKPSMPSAPGESAQELFYAASGSLADEVISDTHEQDRSDQSFRGMASERGNSSIQEKYPLDSKARKAVEGEAGPGLMGIRYSFVQHMESGKEEEVDGRQVTEQWSRLRLAVESNISGYLYVLAPLGNGKWQKLVPVPSPKQEQTVNGIKVKPYRRVEFSLGQMTNTLGKPIVSSLAVLLSKAPLDDLGPWLGREVDMGEFLIEREAGAVFLVETPRISREVLQVLIPLGS